MKMKYFPIGFLDRLDETQDNVAIERKNTAKISIVMPSYNQVHFIERSILSVLNQGHPNLEFIIIDGGSTDGTINLIKKYESHLAYWVSEPDQGQSDALNKGFARATGDIYGWLNSDDLYLPDAFHSAITVLQKHKDKGLVFGDWLSIDKEDKTIDLNYAFDFNLKHFTYEGFHLNAQSMFWRSHLHRKFSGFDVDLYNTMDYQMILEFGAILGDNKFFRIPKILGAFRHYEGQKTAGASPRVLSEHKKIALRYGYIDKYSFMGKLKRLPYRFRRAFWYLKRGGIAELTRRIDMSLKNSL